MDKKERLKLFERELSYIYDDDVRDFAEEILTRANDYFFNVPASSSGKYHPLMSLGEGGLIRHTRAVAYFANEYARSEITFGGDFTERDRDLLVFCAIAHDIKKQGENGSTGHTVSEHPYLAAEFVKSINDEKGYLDKEEMTKVYNAIHKHMGPWQNPKPSTTFERLLYYADYTASRKEIRIDFISEGVTTPEERPVKTTEVTVDNYVFSFGQTKGLTIKESVEQNRGYMDWLCNHKNFNNKDVQKLVQEYYKREKLI